MKGNRSINLVTIGLALAVSAAVRLVWFGANQDRNEEAAPHRIPPGVVSLDSLPFDSSLEPAKLDLKNDGSIIINGESSSIDNLQAILPTWIKEHRIVSIYCEPNATNDFAYTKKVNDLLGKSGLSTQGRFDPQK